MPPLMSLLWQSEATREVEKAGVRAERVHAQIGVQEIDNIRRSFLVGFFQELKGLFPFSQSQIYDSDHVWRDVGDFRLPLQFAQYLLGFGLSTHRCVQVSKSRGCIQIALR